MALRDPPVDSLCAAGVAAGAPVATAPEATAVPGGGVAAAEGETVAASGAARVKASVPVKGSSPIIIKLETAISQRRLDT